VDPLVAATAQQIADVINDFKRKLDQRDGTWASAQGTVEFALHSQTFVLAIVPDEDGKEYPITVQATLKPHQGTNGIINAPVSPAYKLTKHASDTELERDLVSRKKRKLDEHDNILNEQPAIEVDEDIKPLITKEDINDLLVKLREDIQEDTSECVNHVQRLLRRVKGERHGMSKLDHQQSHIRQTREPFRDSVGGNHTIPAASFPSPSADRDEQNATVPDIIRHETKLISTQIKWVEDCRRVAMDINDKREETWRTSSAGFHDRQRQDRENFQNRILHESGMHTQTLNSILNEVKAIGLYAQNMKWETPNSHLVYPSPS
ncbi:uncharacterized protein K460DRAFT_239528, partial [Cucurbitaria berberidis CBS 394.84]